MRKQISSWLAITIIGVLACVSAGFVLWQNKKGNADYNWQPLTVKTQQNETAGLETYKNEKYGFEFKYPTNWGKYDTQDFEVILRPTVKNIPESIFIDVSCFKQETVIKIDPLTIIDIKPVIKKIGEREFSYHKNMPDCNYDDTCIRRDSYSRKENNKNCVISMEVEGLPDQAKKFGKDYLNDEYLTKELEALNQTLSTFKFDETASWKTYRDEKYQFEVKYPQAQEMVNLVSSAEDQNIGLKHTTCFSTEPGGGIGSFCVGFYSNEKSYNLDEFISKVIQPMRFEDTITSQINVSGLQGTKFFSFKDHLVEVFVRRNRSQIVHIYWPDLVGPGDSSIELFNKFLSTFKFTDQAQFLYLPTYRNEKYGFQISIPRSDIGYNVIEDKEGYDVSFGYKTSDDSWSEGYEIFRVGVFENERYEAIKSECKAEAGGGDYFSLCPIVVLGSNSKYTFELAVVDGRPLPELTKVFEEAREIYKSKQFPGFVTFEPI